MAQSSSSSNIESNNDSGIVCKCNRSSKIVRAWTKENPGRRFYGCPGYKQDRRVSNCNFLRWYDVEKPNGWQFLALLEARDVMLGQKEEIKKLRDALGAASRETDSVEDLIAVEEALKISEEKCEGLKRDVLILAERSRIYRNVLLTTTIGLTVTMGFIIGMLKQ